MDQEPDKNRPYRTLLARSSIHLHDLLAILLFLSPLLSPPLPRFNQLHEAKYRTGHQKSEAIASEQTSGSSCRQVFDSTARVVDRRCYTLVRSASASASACPSSPRPKLQRPSLSLVEFVKKFTVTSAFFYARCSTIRTDNAPPNWLGIRRPTFGILSTKARVERA